jgi:hypothetical protein
LAFDFSNQLHGCIGVRFASATSKGNAVPKISQIFPAKVTGMSDAETWL